MKFQFIINSMFLGVGLAMDAFSVSCANALREPEMKFLRMAGIAMVYALFQFTMPMAGWVCVRTIAAAFRAFSRAIPWIALILLLWIGGRMLYEGIKGRRGGDSRILSFGTLLLQGIATSIDALSVGFTIADYDLLMAVYSSLIIAAVTYCICMGGLAIGKKVGMKLSGRASILGGVILVAIGIEIFIAGF